MHLVTPPPPSPRLQVVLYPNRVLKCDVIKIKFLTSLDLSGYSERTMSKRPTCQKWAFRGKLSLRLYVAQLCLENSIHTLASKLFWSTPKSMEFSKYNRLTSQRQFSPKCSLINFLWRHHFSTLFLLGITVVRWKEWIDENTISKRTAIDTLRSWYKFRFNTDSFMPQGDVSFYIIWFFFTFSKASSSVPPYYHARWHSQPAS